MKRPAFERLLDYLDGRLGESFAQSVAAHLDSGCSRCGEDGEWYKRVCAVAAGDTSIAPPPWVLKRAINIFQSRAARPFTAGHQSEPSTGHAIARLSELVASLVFDSSSRPVIVGSRLHEHSNRQLVYRADDYTIDLHITPSGKSRSRVIGQILREGEYGFTSVAGISVELIENRLNVFSTITNQVGEFTLSEAQNGEFDLRVKTEGGSITIHGLPIMPF